ncbi:hypothetical protein [Cochleicola gelatinilyticus]|uniref:Sulfotransferase family protein n=1 Tax=Cochleicola gelatinilyticus TaxID=1763537 RepID=A0A167G8Q6_9FLAO|nr:hypothetical protein [Cochleicola gelatinilyticus]OAB77336.1 hypothetical protein ULVI_12600 [Cochleicola gelatinilyticus]
MFYSKWWIYTNIYLKWVRKQQLEKYLQQIKDGEKPLFIHINRTAGSSIANALQITEAHYTLAEYETLYKNKFKTSLPLDIELISSIRNPYDKVVSEYFYRKKTNQNNINTLSFADWVVEAYQKKNPKYRDREIMFLPQVFWLRGYEKYNLKLIRYENLEYDYKKLILPNSRRKLPWKKKTERKPIKEYYTKEIKAIIYNEFRKDFDIFKYPKE